VDEPSATAPHDAPVLDRDTLLRAAPVLARLAASAWWRATGWTVSASVRASVRMVRAAAAGEPPAALLREAESELRDYLRRLLGVGENGSAPASGRGRGSEAWEGTTAGAAAAAARAGGGAASGARAGAHSGSPTDTPDGRLSTEALRERGAELLRRSAALDDDPGAHPAYARILSEVAPDEARILRLLAIEGPQPAVDVRTGSPLGVAKSDLVAGGISMIGAQAGIRRVERVHQYLNNLYRLGLIWFSREQLDDMPRYQVLEAQPAVTAALERAGRGARTVRRSIHLTPFGIDFCKFVLPLDTAEIDALPGDA
jgi:hypothetical protein